MHNVDAGEKGLLRRPWVNSRLLRGPWRDLHVGCGADKRVTFRSWSIKSQTMLRHSQKITITCWPLTSLIPAIVFSGASPAAHLWAIMDGFPGSSTASTRSFDNCGKRNFHKAIKPLITTITLIPQQFVNPEITTSAPTIWGAKNLQWFDIMFNVVFLPGPREAFVVFWRVGAWLQLSVTRGVPATRGVCQGKAHTQLAMSDAFCASLKITNTNGHHMIMMIAAVIQVKRSGYVYTKFNVTHSIKITVIYQH